jgi:RNAse (barnase) inhibitor barstar
MAAFEVLTADDDALDAWIEERRGDGAAVGVIDGRAAATEPDFFAALSAAFDLPDYFGFNWNAVDEVLDDLTWLPAEEYVLVVRNAVWVIDDEPQERLRILVDVLRTASVDDPDRRGAPLRKGPFTTVLHASPGEEEHLRRRFDAVGADL